MKRKTKAWILIIALIIIISNFPPLNYFLIERYTYQNKDGSFKYTEEPAKGLNFEVGKIRFERFKKQHPENVNRTLYKTFSLKPWRFWEWYSMIVDHDKYKLKYLNLN